MAVKQIGGRWCVEFQQRGKRVFRRCPQGVSKADAQQLEAKLRRELFGEQSLGIRPALPIAAALQTWLEDVLPHRKDQRMPKSNALTWAAFVKGKTVEQAPDVAAAAIKAWKAAGLAPATINRRLSALKAAIRYCWKRGLIERDPSGRITKLQEPAGREVYLSPAEVRKLARHAPNAECRAGIMLLAYTGLRYGELVRAEARDGALFVKDSKNGSNRRVPIAAPAKSYLKNLPTGVPHRTFAGWFWHARKAAGLEQVHVHDLRHTAASMLANAGASLPVIGAMLGHKAPQTTKRYSHLTDKTLEKAVAKLR